MIRREEGRDLALAVHRGEPNAVLRLVQAYQDALFSYACRLVQDRCDAQEVTQDTFIRAWRALHRYSAERCRTLTLRSWLFQITRNLASNKRRSRRRSRAATEAAAESLIRRGAAMEQGIETSGKLIRLEQAMESLGCERRELLTLRFIEEMSYAEMATVVESTEAAIRGKVFRALRILRKRLDEQEEEDAM